MDNRQRRQAENEIRFRAVNENIESLGEELFSGQASGARAWDFVCECHRATCTEQVPLSVPEYETVRASGRRFVVAPSAEHVDRAVEEVVDRSTRYWVVEKTGEPGAAAEAADPRD